MNKVVKIIITLFCIWRLYVYVYNSSLREDTELKLSNDDFKESIEKFYANKQLSAIHQLKATPRYPTPLVLAHFANRSYSDCQHEDPEPPEGWHLLTTASNFWFINGYFGIAYWHPEHQQVVIAHRGTKNVGAILTDLVGVILNMQVNQMNSASTFANKVVAVLQEIERKKKVSFEVFFTGHSLGGWLAQISSFTTEYLEEKGGIFLKKLQREEHKPLASSTVQNSNDIQDVCLAQHISFPFKYVKDKAGICLEREEHEPLASITVQESHDVTHSYHPHTVVFDSPGCKDMLSQMADKFDVRLYGRSIDLQHLDITSYLSAPNLINTRNKHLGTVYRIVTDLSDMDWTLLYNSATHSMVKILQVFDPETGQVGKDDKGEPKIYEVVDWPVSAVLTDNPEYSSIFKSGNHDNNYHPQVNDTVPNKLPQDDPLHYQTMPYDERSMSLSVFTQDEREFLEQYLSLRNVSEFFMLREVLSVMNNGEAVEEAEKKLRNFQLGNGRFSCPDASTLHAIIPYVRRLVRLFPHIKEKVKDQSSIRKIFYQHETQLYVEKIDQSALDFKPGALRLREFLTGDQQIWQLRMIDGDAWTGIIKVYRVLQNTSGTPNYSKEGHYTIVELGKLLTDNRKVNLTALLELTQTPHLLMIECRDNQTVNDELKNISKELFSILKQKNSMKIILTAKLECKTADFLEKIATETLGEGLVTTNETLNWCDLTASSQRRILEKTVIFQGTSIFLNNLTSAESMTDSFPLADLLQEKEVRIGEEPVLSAISGYNEKYYIDRTFNHNIVIRQNILADKLEGKFTDLVASSEQEFKDLCQNNPTRNVHWLVKNESGELIWQQSQGNLTKLREYVDAHKPHSYTPSDLGKLLQQAKDQRVMIIADTAGMGKTTVLTHLSKCIKQKYPAHWLVRIYLNDYTELLEAQKKNKMDKQRVLEFISEGVLKLQSPSENEFFKTSFEGNGVNKVVVMVDGFDEISPEFKETVLDMLQVLKQASLEQLWVTTRSHLKNELEDNLQQLSYTLKPFSEVEQVEFLKNFWLRNVSIENTNQTRLEIYAKLLIRKLADSISDKDRDLTGIPLQTRMLAEAFEQDFVTFNVSGKFKPELPHKLDLLGLYRLFIERKYNIYYEEKSKISATVVAAQRLRQPFFKQLEEEHELLALEALLTEDQVTLLKTDKVYTLSDEDLARIGIARRNNDKKPQFIHRTFSQLYVAEFLIKHLTQKTEKFKEMQDFLLNEVLLKSDYHVIRAFFDGLLEKILPSKQALKDYGKKLDKQWNEREKHWLLSFDTTALHEAAREDNAHIIGFLLDSLQSGEHSDIQTKMLLARDILGLTVLHMAAEGKSVQALKEIKKWADEAHLNTKELNEWLRATNRLGYTAWQIAVQKGNLQVIEILWNWAKEVGLNPDEYLLSLGGKGVTPLHIAASENHVEILEKLWVWAEEGQPNSNELKKNMLLAKDNEGCTAWHRAAGSGSLEALVILYRWAKETGLNTDELLLAQSGAELTALLSAAGNNHVGMLQQLWLWAEEGQLNSKELKKKLLLAKDDKGFTPWHRAAGLEALVILYHWAKETGINTDEFLLAKSKTGLTVLFMAVKDNHVGILQKLWVWAEEGQLNSNELKKKLLLAKDNVGLTAWKIAAIYGRLEALEILWNWHKELGLNPHELLLAQIWQGNTALHMAAIKNFVGVLQKLWVWAEEAQQNSNELKKKLLLAKDNKGFTVWHHAAHLGHLEAFEIIWNWAKEAELKPDELLLAQSEEGMTALLLAVKENHLGILKELWVWAEEGQLNSKELKKKLLLAKDNEGLTAWHLAARIRSLEALEILFRWAMELGLNPIELLFAQSEAGLTAFQLAEEENYLEYYINHVSGPNYC